MKKAVPLRAHSDRAWRSGNERRIWRRTFGARVAVVPALIPALLACALLALASDAKAAVRVAAIGDYGEVGDAQLAVSNLVKSFNPDIIITMGDNSYDDVSIDDNVGQYYSDFIGSYVGVYGPGSLQGNRFFPSLGNHDYSDGLGLEGYLEYFTLPGLDVETSGTSGNERYYDFVYGPVHFFAINSCAGEPDGEDAESIQAQWLQQQLAASTQPWKIVYFHHAAYSSGDKHGNNEYMQWPFKEWGASAVLGGHDHVYERFLIDGLPYFVNGLGGRSLRPFDNDPQPGSMARYSDDYGAMLITADDTGLHFEFYSINPADSLVDSFTLEGNAPAAVPLPSAVSYSPTHVNTVTLQYLSIHNSGNAALEIAGVSVDGPDAAEFLVPGMNRQPPGRNERIASTIASVDPGDAFPVTVRFAPTSAGTKRATLQIVSNDPHEGTLDVPIVALALPPRVPDIVTPSGDLDFGTVAGPTALTLDLVNVGSASLHIQELFVLGDRANEFSVVDVSAWTVAPEDSASIAVEFAPTSDGFKYATLRLESDDPDENPLDIALSGTASSVSVPDVASAAALDFGGLLVGGAAATQHVDVTNRGTAGLLLSDVSIVGGGAASFMISQPPATMLLTPGDSTQVEVAFSPIDVGQQEAALRIESNDPNDSPLDVMLKGAGVDPWGAQTQVQLRESETGDSNGSTSVQTDGNVSAVDDHLYLVAIASKPYRGVTTVEGLGLNWTRLVDQCSGREQTGVHLWMGRGSPVPGQVSADFDGSTDSAVLLVSRYAGAAGASPLGEVVSSNTNGESGECSGGHDSNEFELQLETSVPGGLVFGAVAMRNRSVEPGSGYTLLDEVRSGSGGRAASIATMDQLFPVPGSVTFDGALSSGVDWAAAACEIRPQVSVPEITVTPLSHDFGAVDVGTSASKSFVVHNDGNDELQLPAISIVPPEAGPFLITSGSGPNSLAPGASRTVRVSFEPQGAGAAQAVLRIVSNDADEVTTDVALSGFMAAPIVEVVPTHLEFGEPPVGSSVTRSVRIRNIGDGNLDLLSSFMMGPNAEAFRLESSIPLKLLPTDSIDLAIVFTPHDTDPSSATLRLTTNSPALPSLDVSLSGNVPLPPVPEIALTPTSHDFGTVQTGASVTLQVRVYNQGTTALDVAQTTSIGPDSLDFSITQGGAPFTVGAGDSADVNVTFTPSSDGPKNAALRVHSNDEDEAVLDVALIGIGYTPSAIDVVFEESVSGDASNSTSVGTESSLAAADGSLYLAAVASKGYQPVTGVTGLGLTWSLVQAQCGAREQTGIEVWMGSGSPSPGTVTATLDQQADESVLVVSRYSGVDPLDPFGSMLSANTNGESGDCSGGSDDDSFDLEMTTTNADAWVYVAVAMRNRSVTPGDGYILRDEVSHGSGGTVASVAILDQEFAIPDEVTLDGSFSGDVDWAVVGIEIKPASPAAKQVNAALPRTAGLALRNGIGGINPWIELASPRPSHSNVRIYDVRGRLVDTVWKGAVPAGNTRIAWSGVDRFGRLMPAGIYLVRAEIGSSILTGKLIILR